MLAGLALGTAAVGRDALGADRVPGTGPWELRALQRPPEAQWGEPKPVTEQSREVLLSEVRYAGEPWQGRPTRVFGYYARPATPPGEAPRRLPAMVLVHGGGGTAFPEWARLWAARGYAALAMDLGGRGPNRQPLSDGGPDQNDEWKFRRLKDGVRNTWPYQSVAAVIRAVSLLRSVPEVDRDRIGITGISWGGYLTSLVMSLDDRLKVAIPVYGCGFLHENSVWLPIFGELPEAERAQWVENFDPSRYLPRCRLPVLWVNGTNDFAYPLDSYQKSYRSVRGPRTLCITVRMPHGHPQGWAPPEIALFADSILRPETGEPGLARVTAPAFGGNRVRVTFHSATPIREARLHWTTDLDKPWQERDWKTSPGRVRQEDLAEADLPAARPALLFFTLVDTRGAVTSSEHISVPRG